MSAAKVFSVTLSLVGLPITIYGSWLVYKHIGATELMWFIWWIQIPILIITNVMSKAMDD